MASRQPDRKKVQMMDIARMAGVSASTVSRALNGSELIHPETRQRINELAKSLNYTINQSAKNLRLGENRTIGVVIPYAQNTRQHITDPFFLAMLGSLADALTDQNYDMLLSRVDSDRLADLAALYDTGRASGIIVIGQWGHHDQLNDLAARRVPMVVWGAQLPQQLYVSVGSDNLGGGVLATEHLVEQGRKRIAFMGDIHLPEPAKRYEGYLLAHKKARRKVWPELLIPSPFTPLDAQAAMAAFLDRGVAFDGLVAASDVMAINAMGVMRARGLDVPKDVSVVGYDDIDQAAHSFPPLTTVRQPMDLAGETITRTLLAMLKGEAVTSQVTPTSLVVRASTLQSSAAVDAGAST